MGKENKTTRTDVPVADFLATVSEKRREEAGQLIAIMQDISGEEPYMWGPSIIGFGQQHYKYDTGREGDIGILGFSPRKASLTVYFNEGFDHYGEELARLGKYKSSVSCLYINKLADVDMDVLKTMLEKSWKRAAQPEQQPSTVENYIRQVPPQARKQFDALRAIVRREMPDASEVLSYGILGYKQDKRRARVYISAFKDHVAMYPAPLQPELQEELKLHLHGKRSVWFSLNDPLPEELIVRLINAMTAV